MTLKLDVAAQPGWRQGLTWLAVSVILVFAASKIGSAVSVANIDPWYASLAKPAWTPPNAVFGPVWTVLYVLMALAAWLVWRASGWRRGKRALLLYAMQLILNFLWPILFFGFGWVFVALVDAVALWALLLATLLEFRRHSTLATAGLVPYLLWVSYAVFLNWSVWRLNV